MFATTIAGSLPRPDWLAEPEILKGGWKLEGEELEAGKKRACEEWIRHQEAAGIDILTDGEVFRTHFVHSFLKKIEGIDQSKKTLMGIRDNRYDLEVPTVTGPVSRPAPVFLDDFKFTRSLTDKQLKITLPGPMTICDTIADDHYGSRPDMAMAFAELLNDEAKELEAAGADVVQFDEPTVLDDPLQPVAVLELHSHVHVELADLAVPHGLAHGLDLLPDLLLRSLALVLRGCGSGDETTDGDREQ